MEIRIIKPEEHLQADKVSTVAFLSQLALTYQEDYAVPGRRAPDKYTHGKSDIWAAFDGNKIVSVTHVKDLKMQFDGHVVGMGGIGGVSTLPEARSGGSIRSINEVILPHMKEQGMVFSVLFPWSFAFYRKFGYELCYTPRRLHIPMKYFVNHPFPSNMTLHEKGEDLAPFLEVYKKFMHDKNLAIERDESNMRFRVDYDPYVSRNYSYLHRDEKGTPDAYIVYTAEVDRESGNTMRIKELCWTAPQGLHAIFGFLGGLAAQFNYCHWDAPFLFNPFPHFAESYELTMTYTPRGMNRVINVQKAFELMRAPVQPGKAVIQVADKFMPCNDGKYALEWDNGAMISVKPTDKDADLETDVETLAQLITGYLNISEVRLKKGVTIKGNDAALAGLFPHKDMMMLDYF